MSGRMEAPLRPLGEERGQMCVELAVLLPVTLAVALVVVNLARYVELCSRFDRVALDVVMAQGVSPVGSQDATGATEAVRSALEDAFADVDGLEVSVGQVAVGRLGGGEATFSLLPTLTRFECEMRLRPWPSALSIAGVSIAAPPFMVHRRSLVVDRFRAGVVV